MKLRKTITYIFALISFLAAEDEKAVITAIFVSGNDVTVERIILRELDFKLGDSIDMVALRVSRDRLYNLGIFEQVVIAPSYQNIDSVIISINLVESIRVLPAPIFYYRDDVGWSYGAGLTFLNFRGRNQRFLISGTIGGEETYRLSFADPWFTGERVSLNGGATRYFRDHPVFPFRSRVTVFRASLGKWLLGKRLFLNVGLGFTNHRQYGNADELPPLPSDTRPPPQEYPRRYTYLSSTLSVAYIGTDVWRDPTRGIKASLNFVPHLGGDEAYERDSFARLEGRLAGFFKLLSGYRPLVLASGLRFLTNWGNSPNYSRNFLGGSWVRGYDIVPDQNAPEITKRLEGKNVVGGVIELRQTAFPRILVLGMEIGLSVVAFSDVAWAYESDLSTAQPVMSYGVGLRLFVPFVQALAIDWGFNPYDSASQLRFSIGQRF